MSVFSQLSQSIPTNAGDHRHWGAMPDGGLPYTIWRAQQASDAPILLVANDAQQAHSLELALEFFESKQIGSDNEETKSSNVMVFPDWETLPYDVFSPHDDIISQRLSTLTKLGGFKSGVLIVSQQNLMQRIPPAEFLASNSLFVKVGEDFDVMTYREQLEKVGYRHVDTVYEHGEYATRGSIFDVFPMGRDTPVRIELFDDEVESLRFFDPETQRSLAKTDKVSMLPANEFPWDGTSRLSFRNRWLEKFPNSASNSPLLRDLKEGIKPHGIEYYGPLFFEQMASLFDYLPANTLVVSSNEISRGLEQFAKDVVDRYEDRRHDIERPILHPMDLYLSVEECFSKLKQFPRISLSASSVLKAPISKSSPEDDLETSQKGRHDLALEAVPNLAVDERQDNPVSALQAWLLERQSARTILVTDSAGRREIVTELLSKHGIQCEPVSDWDSAFQHDVSKPLITYGSLPAGFSLPTEALHVVTEYELFGQRVQQSRRQKRSDSQIDNAVKNLTELSIGAPVVHIDHGVGRYRGLESIEVDGRTNEFLMLDYADGAKLYVPVASLQLISRYSGTDEALAPLHKLGTEKWSVAKQKAMEKVRDTAAELLEVYAKREAREGFQYEHPGQAYRSFCANFPFEETADQKVAINAVVQDMTKTQPMDRLVCGDVGFGKTEVAMRAAFMATYSAKQVAVLVPTTLLAKQHYESFVDRFADTAIRIEVLSRFKTANEQDAVLKDIEDGKVDIVVGTHKLIQGNMKFKNLGLLIIDEEHRFGVKQKEQLKAYRAQVDILTLTATPIPRTLNMAMGGLRDLSIIATPPAKRLSVKTFVREKESALIRESMLREILRGGQVYYLFNDVKDMEKEVAELAELVPEARIGFAHGQMRERELEQAMSDFYHLRYNVLVCSTIIETGIDIPNANTIIIDRADKFGLAQLHQLRGRVGRSHHQAYAYLLTPPAKRLTKDAEKRLEAIEASQDLGAGFMLATHDLEIRGAGELLGDDQSGQIQSVGYSLYMELLERAVDSLKVGRELNLEQDVHGAEVNLQLSAIIPDDYVPDVHTRLILYKRISGAKTDADLKNLQVELIDRFGLLPEPCKNLFRQTELKLRLEKIGISKVDAGRTGGKLEFASNTNIDPLSIVKLVQARPDLYRLDGATTLKFYADVESEDQLFTMLDELINKLES